MTGAPFCGVELLASIADEEDFCGPEEGASRGLAFGLFRRETTRVKPSSEGEEVICFELEWTRRLLTNLNQKGSAGRLLGLVKTTRKDKLKC